MIQYNRLSAIIPPDQALGNKAWATSLQQVTGIMYLTLPQYAATVLGIETTNDLNLINALTQPVPSNIVNYYINLGTGDTDNPDIRISNVLGTPSGYVHTKALQNTNTQLATMDTSYLQSVYQTMLNVINGQYDQEVPPEPPDPDPTYITVIPDGTPGAGTYANHDAAILALVAVAQSNITTLQSTYPTQCTSMNSSWNAMAQQIQTERNIQAAADLSFTNVVPSDRNSMLGFVQSIPTYGTDINPAGMRDYITNLTDLSTLTGQAIAGVLREGVNQTVLSSAGIGTGTTIPITP